jgi:glyoxylate reductase
MKKVLITHPIPGKAQEMLNAKGFETILLKDKSKYSESKLVSFLKKYEPDAVISFLIDPIKREAMSASKNLKIVSNFAVGFDNIDLAAAKERGLAVTNTPIDGYSVAEFTASLVVSLVRKITEAHLFTSKGKYKGWDPHIFVGPSLKGRILGIIGSGNIGSSAARILKNGFGMNIVYADLNRNESIEKELGARKVETDELFKIADVISLHVNLNPATKHLVNAERLSMMKPGAYIINTSRGPVVEEEALVDALLKGKIAGAALDVFEFEPKISRKLRSLKNVILTPHIASATTEAREEMSRLAAQNIIDFLEGRKPQGAVYIP